MARNSTFPMVAKTLHGLEETVADELRNIGATNIAIGNRAVTFDGNREVMYVANLALRCATRILRPIAGGKVPDEKRLYSLVRQIRWSDHLSPRQTLAVDAVTNQSSINHSQYAAQTVKDAIVDQMRERFNMRPSVDLDRPDLRINLHINNDNATIALDTSGDPLTRRGYRTEAGEAPLSECLAAGILTLTGYDGSQLLVDGMCGSGTIPIEAALIALNRAPNRDRKHFGFMSFPDYDAALLRTVRGRLRKAELVTPTNDIVGRDIDSRVVSIARANCDRAGVSPFVDIRKADFFRVEPPPREGMLVMNPPYGERIDVADAGKFYRQIGDTLKQQYEGYTAFLFTGNLKAAKQIGLRTSRRIELYNGPLECRLLRFELYAGSRKPNE